MLNGVQAAVCGDGRDNDGSAALQRGRKCCLIYSGQGASEQFIKKGKKKSQARKLIKEMEMPTISGSNKCQPALNQVTRSNPHN